jgi:hypothetical protein
MGVKASYGMGIKVSSAMGSPKLHKMPIQRHKVNSHPLPPPYLHLCLYKNRFLEISRQVEKCSTNKRDLPDSTLFPLY